MTDLDKLMQRVREEIQGENLESSKRVPIAGTQEGFRRKGMLEELLKLSDADFIREAYRTVLGRDVDASAAEHLKKRLREGKSSRLSILRELGESDEGRRHAAPIVLPQGRKRLTERLDPRKLIYKLLGIRWLVKLGEQLKTADRGPIRLAALPAIVNDLMLRTATTDLMNNDLGAEQRRQKSRLDDLVEAIDVKIGEQRRYILELERRLNVVTEVIQASPPKPTTESPRANSQSARSESRFDALYVEFEDRYRGTREDIRNRQSVYLPRVKDAAAASGFSSFLDIGCGRGEFLELLEANGFTARGVDSNHAMAAGCRDRGFDVTVCDGLSFLRSLPADSLAGISGFHIIEHVPFAVIIELFDEARRVLAPDGVLIFETPNPANLIVAAERFYFDPTHRHPLPSELISFVAQARGFVDVEVVHLHPVDVARKNYDDALLTLLQEKFYGPQDYGLIARKAR